MSSRLHFLCFSPDTNAQTRCFDLASEFQYSFLSLINLVDEEKLSESKNTYEQVQFILVHTNHLKSISEILRLVDLVRKHHKESFICVVAESATSTLDLQLIKKSGASLILFEKEFYATSRLEYLASQIIRGSYIPVKLSEFPKDSVLNFSLYHLMPLNQKLVPVVPRGTALTEARLTKLESVGEMFVRRDDVDGYLQFIESHPDVSSAGLRSRCRAQYLSFCSAHAQLLFLLADQAEKTSYKECKWLYDRCAILAQNLLMALTAIGEAWEIVNVASLGEFGSVERAPAVAAYAGLLSFSSSTAEPLDVMMAALLSDVGMLELEPAITKKIRMSHDATGMSSEEQKKYQEHPIISVRHCLSEKLPISPEIQEMILCSHERVDATGFPFGKREDKIPFGAMLIQFSEMIDQRAMVRMGQARKSVHEVRRELVAQELTRAQVFNIGFLTKLHPIL